MSNDQDAMEYSSEEEDEQSLEDLMDKKKKVIIYCFIKKITISFIYHLFNKLYLKIFI